MLTSASMPQVVLDEALPEEGVATSNEEDKGGSVEADIVRNKQELIDTVHDTLGVLQGGDAYMNQESYPASSSLHSGGDKKEKGPATPPALDKGQSDIEIQSFFNSLDKPLKEGAYRLQIERELDVALAKRNMIKAQAQMSKCEMDEEEEQYRNVLAALYDGHVSNDVASQAEAKFQINMLQHECDKMELVTAEAQLDTARIRLENAQKLELKAKRRLVRKMDKITSIVRNFSHIMTSVPRTFFFVCNCNLYGLMGFYTKTLLKRKMWKMYPDEKWFRFKNGTGKQVYCPLANVTVDFCDQSIYTLSNPIINGNIYFSSKIKLARLMMHCTSDILLIPPTFIIENNSIVEGTRLEEMRGDNDVSINNVLYALAQEHLPIWFLKDSALDYSRGITMLQHPWEYKDVLSKENQKGGEKGAKPKLYVLQPHIPDPLLHNGTHKFHIRVYMLIHKPSKILLKSSGMERPEGTRDFYLYVYTDGWLDIATMPFTGNVNVENTSASSSGVCDKSNISRDRTSRWKAWEHYERSFPILKNATQFLVQIVKRKLDALERFGEDDENAKRLQRQNQFELFGCDYMFNNDFKPFLLEVNSGPVCKASEEEMVKKMLDIVLPFGRDKADENVERDDPSADRWVEVPLF